MTVEELRKRKKSLSITTAELAYLAELPVGTVSKIMTGETRNPRLVTIEKLDDALANEEARRRLEAYLNAMKEYYLSHPEALGKPNEFESIYRQLHNLEDKPIEEANSLTEEYPIWGSVVGQKGNIISADTFLHRSYDNRWIELYEGNVIINQAPNLEHQLMIKSINKQIESFIDRKKGKCQVFDMGINVRLDEDEDTILIPDILVLCDEDKLRPFGILGAPDWVIEVISPSTRQYDYKKKTLKYMMNGVCELWLVDIEKKIVVTYVDNEYMVSHLYQFGDDIPVSIYNNELTINVK